MIELLVVVLIIGILAAVAVPQYETAVQKSRMAQIIVWGEDAVRSAELYYMANGAYPKSFLDMDVQIPGCVHADNYYSNCPDNKYVVSAEISNGGLYLNLREKAFPSWTRYYRVFEHGKYASYMHKRLCVPTSKEDSVQLCKRLSGKEPVSIWSGQGYPLD